MARLPGDALRGGDRHRAAARWTVRRPPQLALGVLHQPAVRDRRRRDPRCRACTSRSVGCSTRSTTSARCSSPPRSLRSWCSRPRVARTSTGCHPSRARCCVVFLVCAVAFGWRERTAAEPFVPLRLFRNDVLRIAVPLNFTSGLVFYLGVFFLPVFFQEVADVDATASGLLLIPFMIGTAVSTTFAGHRVERTGRYRAWPIVGGVAMTVGALALTTIGLDTSVVLVAGSRGRSSGSASGSRCRRPCWRCRTQPTPADMGMATSTAHARAHARRHRGDAAVRRGARAQRPAHHATAAEFADALPWVFACAVPISLLVLLFALLLPHHELRRRQRGHRRHRRRSRTDPSPSRSGAPTASW